MRRRRAVGGQVQDLNLSGNGLSDVAFHLITLQYVPFTPESNAKELKRLPPASLLTPSPHPTSITHLYLSNNKITLEPDLGHFLGIALSSPASSLACLSLTNNKRIGTPGLRSLLASLRLGPKSNLTQLHMSLCHITPDAAEVIASWLEDPAGGGTRLQAFCANGNFISSPGLRRIAHAVISGRCSGLLLLESLANEEGEEGEAEVWKDEIARLDEGEEEVEGWSSRLAKATERNKRVFKETRLAALGLLARARVLFAGNPHEPAVDVAEIRRGVEVMLASSQDLFLQSPPPPSGTFPFLRLPIEIQVHVLRASLLLTPSREAHLYPPLSAASSSTSPPPNHDTTLLSSPLTESQFLRLLSHAASRSTLATEIQIARAEAAGGASRVASLNGFQNGRKENFGAKSDEAKAGSAGGGLGWEEWVLRETGCDRFQRT